MRKRLLDMDVAWMLGDESKKDDWELRMSMRSFWVRFGERSGYWIIGHIPRWIDTQQVRCIPWPDPYKHCKDANLLLKALRLTMEPELSNPFVLCSDDQLLLRDCQPEDFKPWYEAPIPEAVEENMSRWQRRLVNTGVKLRGLGYSALNYDCHVPCAVRKEAIRDVLRFDFGAKPGMCIFSTILNCGTEPGVKLSSERVRAWLGEPNMPNEVINKKMAQNKFACFNDLALENPYIVERIEQLFALPAPWELGLDSGPSLKVM